MVLGSKLENTCSVCEFFNLLKVECYHKDTINKLIEKIEREAHPVYGNN
jgi:hypothetical protein